MSRSEQARATRRGIIESAAHLFERDGYTPTTMERLADEAGVAVQTVYYTFGTKGRVLCEAMEFVAAGTHDPIPVERRPWMVESLEEKSATRSLAIAIGHGTDIYQRAAPLWPAVNAAAITDRAVSEYWNGVAAGRRVAMGRLVSHLSDLVGLRRGLEVDTATDIMFVVNNHATFQALVVQSGWPLPRFKGWLYSTLLGQLLPPVAPDPAATEGLGFSVWPEG